jgi:hypothetical protein
MKALDKEAADLQKEIDALAKSAASGSPQVYFLPHDLVHDCISFDRSSFFQ